MRLRRRDTTRLIHDILCLAKTSPSKNRIRSEVNLRFSQADAYLAFLLQKGHLAVDPGKNNGAKAYTLTPKGERLLGFLMAIQGELEGLLVVPIASKVVSHRQFLIGPNDAPADAVHRGGRATV